MPRDVSTNATEPPVVSRNARDGDLRVRRTRTHLRQALAELMAQRPLSGIGVAEICAAAMVHRTTFYKHYPDKHALFDDLLDDRVDRLLSTAGMPADRAAEQAADPVEQLVRLLVQLRADEPLFQLLTVPELAAAFTPRLTRELVLQLLGRAPRAGSQSGALRGDLLAHLHAAVLASAMTWWAQSGAGLSPEQLAATVWDVLRQ
jgi:AcrR family transcriptional regulator